MHFFWACACFSLAPVDLSSRVWLRGTQEARRYITTHVWIPAELRGTCSGRSKRNLASSRGIAFRPASRANQAHANPQTAMWWKLSLEGKNSGSICCATFLVYFLAIASSAGHGIVNSEVAGLIPTVIAIKRKKEQKKEYLMFKNL